MSNWHGAFRVLLRQTAFTLPVLVTGALAIACVVLAGMFAYALVWRPLPFSSGEQLFMVWSRPPGSGQPGITSSFEDVWDWRHALAGTATIAAFGPEVTALRGDIGRERIVGAIVEAEFFDTLGIPPIRGRIWAAEEIGAEDLVVISHQLWGNRLGFAEDVIGRQLSIGDRTYSIAAVMPEAFAHPEPLLEGRAQYWRAFRKDEMAYGRGNRFLRAVLRVPTPSARIAAMATIQRVSEESRTRFPKTNATQSITIIALREQLHGNFRDWLWVVVTIAGALTAIAVLNIIQLQTARLFERLGELQTRMSLGATPRLLWNALLAEGVVLGTFVMLAASALIAIGSGLITRFLPPRFLDVVGTFEFTFGVASCVVALGAAFIALISVVPAIGVHLAATRTLPRRSKVWRQAITAAQFAVSVPLIVAAILLLGNQQEVDAIAIGADISNVVSVRISMTGPRYSNKDTIKATALDIQSRLSSSPGVSHAGISYAVPLDPVNADYLKLVRDPLDESNKLLVAYRITDLNFFPTVGARVLDGSVEAFGIGTNVVINREFAKRWPNQSAIGRRILLGADTQSGEWREVIAVIEDIRYGSLLALPQPEVYVSYDRDPRPSIALVVKSVLEPEAAFRVIRSEIAKVDANLVVASPRSLPRVESEQKSRFVLAAGVGMFTGSLACVLAIVGVLGTVSYVVRASRKDVCIRLAIGATPSRVVDTIGREVGIWTIAGLATGCVATFGMARFVQAMMMDPHTTILPTTIVVCGFLFVLAVCVARLAAYSVRRMDPVELLRERV